MERIFVWTIALIFIAFPLYPNDLVSVSVLTNRELVLHFNEGYILHSAYREADNQTKTFIHPLDIEKASNPETYKLLSDKHVSYLDGRSPLHISRKTKGRDFSNDCRWIGGICDNEYIKEHFIYLKLPEPLQQGTDYTLSLHGLAGNIEDYHFTYDHGKIRSSAIHVNQVGYLPGATVKKAFLSHWMGDGGPLDLDDYQNASFYLLDARTGAKVFEGNIEKRFDMQNAGQPDLPRTPHVPYLSMSDVWECDFSGFSQHGDYIVCVEDMGVSYPFKIHPNVYKELYYQVTRQLYHQRTGMALEQPYTEWTRPRTLHHADGMVKLQYTASKWTDWQNPNRENGTRDEVYGKLLPDFQLKTWGWYMDAGDWDGYYSHLRVPRLLMTAFELAPENFADGDLNIPESGNGIPDILDEARFLIDYLDRTRGPSGGIAGARIHPDFEQKPVDKIPSWEDERIWTISGEDAVTTYTFAGLSAQLAHTFKHLDKTDSVIKWMQKAQVAYTWAENNSDPDTESLRHARSYAAAWMFKMSGNEVYHNVFKTDISRSQPGQWSDDNREWAIWAYISIDDENVDLSLKNQHISGLISKVEADILKPVAERSFPVGFSYNFITFLGQATTPQVLPALVLYQITGDEKYKSAALSSCDYYLGANPLDMTWVVGMGHLAPLQILHLDTWLHPDRRTDFIPGTIPYGPTFYGGGWPRNNGPWASEFAMDRMYPGHGVWPLHEAFFNNRYAVPTNEYTIHQTTAPASAVYALLSGKTNIAFTPNKAPSVSITLPEFIEGEPALISAEASDEDGFIYKVEFYNGWRKIGEVYETPYEMQWQKVPGGELEVYAVAVDNQGKRRHTKVVKPHVKPSSIQLNKSSLELFPGDSETLLASLSPENVTIPSVFWRSEQPEIASVNGRGLVTALKPGKTIVRVKAAEGGLEDFCEVQVNEVITTLPDFERSGRLFPNPVTDGTLYIHVSNADSRAELTLVNSAGMMVNRDLMLSGNEAGIFELDVRGLQKGLYMLTFVTPKESHQFRFVVK